MNITPHAALLFVHVASVIVGMGTAVFLHLNVLRPGMRWSSFRDTFHFGSRVIWVGLGCAIVSGILLWGMENEPLPRIFYAKLALVAMLVIDGVVINRVGKPRLNLLRPDQHFLDLPKEHKRAFTVSGALSVLGWWGALFIAFIL